MKMGVFVTDYAQCNDTLGRLGDAGLLLVLNGVYHAALKEKGKASPLLDKYKTIHVLREDLKTRGIEESAVDARVKVVDMGGLVDVAMKDYEKLVWC
jgi:sulfur relay protein TusB/DsrH